MRFPVARTPLHHWHTAHGARFVDRDGWQVVAAYSSADPEAAAARAGLGLADLSAFAKISLRGRGVSAFVASYAPDSPALNQRGVASLPSESVLACRLTDDHLLLLASGSTAPGLIQRLEESHKETEVVQTDVTSAHAGFEVIGPDLEGLLRRLTHLDIRPAALPVNTCAETALAGVEAVLVRLERRSLPALRVYVSWDLGEYVWERMIEAGSDVPITPLGLEALALLQ
jgi:heterotetrameric sarcosine oxidase gamma subunit